MVKSCGVWGAQNLENVGPQAPNGPNISRFISLSRPHLRSFCLYLGVFSWNFGGV